ncbi:hypothetical protein IMSAGC007_04651 [Lachnospiraceae bacterium]|nr:hypothetical protein IMSAGC007_04651 [Lachnospiraceae bacterium]
MEVEIMQAEVRNGSTEIRARAAGTRLKEALERKSSRRAELTVFDGRSITSEQRKKIYAMIGDISAWTGYYPDELKERMKCLYIEKTGKEMFSLASCSIDTARQFLDIIIDFALENSIPLRESGIERTGDIFNYLVSCIYHKKCCICGRPADIHHLDAIGMGHDRMNYDDSENEIIALCRKHHTMAHARGRESFCSLYHVFGVPKMSIEASYQGIFL